MTDGSERPTPPMNLPKYIREGLEKQSADRLRAAAEYATRLANWKEEQAERDLEERADQDADELPDEWDDEEDWESVVEDAREKAGLSGAKGTLTRKTIDGRDYFYLQWREGDKIKSQYVAPVTPANSD